MVAPCFKCNKRSTGCHIACTNYKAFRDSIRSTKAKKKLNRILNDMEAERIRRIKGGHYK